MSERVDIDGRTVEVSNPRKVLFPSDGITKRDLVDYYARVAEVMLPHVRERPVTMHRFPDGIEDEGFYQKEAPDHFPDWIRTVTVPKEGGEVTHVVCDDAATLVYLADQASITPHVWLSTVQTPQAPDRLVFDLDPPETDDSSEPVRFAARAIRDLLADLSLGSRLMTTGSEGFHVVVPLASERGFEEVRDFARHCADVLAHRHPDRLTVEQRIDQRKGRVFLDYLRNAYGQTTIAPYSVRPRTGAPVATPIEWRELGSTHPRSYTVANLFRRLGHKDDPWASDGLGGQSLHTAVQRVASMEEAGA